ncbi:MAG TPA: transcription-repair coupling factor, partial [Planctomycetaceae bacterium]|nr:transcription-repair coupling factor [Planctomycetaceae bacterium]
MLTAQNDRENALSPVTSGQLQQLADGLREHSGFVEVLTSLQQGHGGTIGGTWGAASSLAVAGIASARAGEKTGLVVVVVPHAVDADMFADDLTLFTSLAIDVLPAIESIDDPSADHETLINDPAEAQRLALVKRLVDYSDESPRILVTSMQAVLTPLADPRQIEESTRHLTLGAKVDPQELAEWLLARGWQQVDTLDSPGSFARRGGIIDLFATDWERPVRLELNDDEIDSLRTFDTVSQRSVRTLESIDLTALQSFNKSTHRAWLTDVVPSGTWWSLIEPQELLDEGKRLATILPVKSTLQSEELFTRVYRFPSVILSAIAPTSFEATAHLAVESVERFTGQLDRVCHELDTVGKDQEVWIAAPTEAEEQRLNELLSPSAPARAGRLHFLQGRLSAGFRLVPEKFVLISAAELFRRQDSPRNRLPKHRLTRTIDTFLDLNEGDFVVHVAHGIARYKGLKLLEKHSRTEEFLELEFAESTRVYVPASSIELVQKYVGGGKTGPKLAKIGGTLWTRQKQAVEKAVADMAADMLEIQAVRAKQPGRAFPHDTPWQKAFEQSFQFDPTPDQATAIETIRGDLEQ